MNQTDYAAKSPVTTATYMTKAKREIDELFGEGFAKANPALVATFMQAAVADYAAGLASERLASAIERLAEALEKKP